MINLGDFKVGATVRFMWSTNAASGASITRATNGSIRIYKNSSTTERSSSNGITDTEDFDGLVGVHFCAIDTEDNTDAGFYGAANDYHVVLAGATIDGQTVNVPLARFSIAKHVPDLIDEMFSTEVETILGRTGLSPELKNLVRYIASGVPVQKIAISGTTLTVYESDGTTPLLNATLTTDAGATPITGLTP